MGKSPLPMKTVIFPSAARLSGLVHARSQMLRSRHPTDLSFQEKIPVLCTWENVLGAKDRTYRNVAGKLERLRQLTPVTLNHEANHDQEEHYTSEASLRSLA